MEAGCVWRSRRSQLDQSGFRGFCRGSERFVGGVFNSKAMKQAILIGFCVLMCVMGAQAHKPITSKYTYNEDVFPIFNVRCGRCHIAGGVAPMSLLTYKDAFPWAESIRVELTASHMPPWYAEPGYGEVKLAPRLTPRELDILMTWA